MINEKKCLKNDCILVYYINNINQVNYGNLVMRINDFISMTFVCRNQTKVYFMNYITPGVEINKLCK